MFKGLGNITQLLGQARTMGPKMQAAIENIKDKRVTGSAGGGMVTVEANGAGQILSVSVDPVLAEKNDLEMITDLLPAAINDALTKQKQLHMEAMASVTEDLPIPPGMEGMLKQFMGGGVDGQEEVDNDPNSAGPSRLT